MLVLVQHSSGGRVKHSCTIRYLRVCRITGMVEWNDNFKKSNIIFDSIRVSLEASSLPHLAKDKIDLIYQCSVQ